ncbi:citrulline utilization hydrolase CtlX [Nesterenkonia haasae]|uniref:citrulline utilization hydrolase CtlX n=1 Tax=Nesterenkonia haasae TaxID=2587813 RepID=UPI001391F9C1|nr:arginine deiminase-related protein [Nesterenkonia haasae]NDK32723.1 amidinotransferase [Nesterenkonia haasae]
MSPQLLAAPSVSTLQAPAHVVMVRPHHFSVNPDTAADNAFQHGLPLNATQAARRAYAESTQLADALAAEGIGVSLVEDESGLSPDSVFPNNWFTTHPDGRVVLCPMFVPNRRHERRSDVVDLLRLRFEISDVVDLSEAENHGEFLEGTGSVVIDHRNKLAYGCRSHRLTPGLFQRFCDEIGLQPVLFDAVDSSGTPIYHTNVMMSVGETVSVIGSGLIPDSSDRDRVLGLLSASSEVVVELTESQVRHFAGNVLQLTGHSGPVLVMSTTAYGALRSDQVRAMRRTSRILTVDVSTIEASGGSVRCMLAGVHLPPRRQNVSVPSGIPGGGVLIMS